MKPTRTLMMMMMLYVLLSLVLFVLTALPAHADTLTFTTGAVWQDGATQTTSDSCANAPGYFNPTCVDQAYFNQPLSGTSVSGFHVSLAWIEGVLYTGPPPSPRGSLANNLVMEFAYNPLPALEPYYNEKKGEWYIPRRATSPFTMSGSLSLFDSDGGPVVFDVAGEGTLERYWREEAAGHPFLHVQFNFEEPKYVKHDTTHSLTHGWVDGEWVEYGTVPETAAVVLVGVGLVGLIWTLKAKSC